MRSVIAGVLFVALVAGCSSDHPDMMDGVATSPPSVESTPPTSAAATTAPTTTTTTTPATTTLATTTLATTTPATTTPVRADPDGIGDVLYPSLGNPGILVTHYGIDITYEPKSRDLQGVITMAITATAALPELTLDAIALDVTAVTIDGQSADFETDDPELHITPATPIAEGADVSVVVTYSVTPETGHSPVTEAGFFPTDDGGYTVDEPDGTRLWMPSNDHPSDKATYDFTLHVPTGLAGIANGRMTGHDTETDGEVWTWTQDEPMATYLLQIIVGDYVVVDGTGPNGLDLTSVVLRGDEQLMAPFIDEIPDQIDYFDQYFGPYPFDNYGLAMTDSESGLGMEEQGRSLFSREDFADGELGFEQEALLSHELAHQWFGDAVSPSQWQDIWLNESFATYAEWMWLDHLGEQGIDEVAQRTLEQRRGGDTSTGSPDVDHLFSYEVYDGGAAVLHALRATVGDDTFFDLLTRWVQDNRFESRTSADFIALAEQVSGQDLGQFFDDWLYAVDLPKTFPS